MSKLKYITVLLFLLLVEDALAYRPTVRKNRGWWHQEWTVDKNGDSIATIHALPVYVYSRKVDLRRYRRLVNAVKKVYPIAQIAKKEMEGMEEELAALPTRKAQKAYLAGVQKRIVKQYTPLVKRMTRYEGKVLLKLIDRETEYTAFQIIKEFRGGFVAGFWQTMAKLFGNNLKLDYDPENNIDDKQLEKIVVFYERGLL